MSKEIEKSNKRPVLVTLLTLAALAGLIRFIVKTISDSDAPWEN